RLARYPVERYPVQHATAQFHLGVALTNEGRLPEAEAALGTAAGVFSGRMPVEYAKTMNALGAVLRMQGRTSESIEAFRSAGTLFATAGLRPEEGAALYNLGLAQREGGDLAGAIASFRRAGERFADGNATARAASMRELGAALLQSGDVVAAITTLTQAIEMARNMGDQPGLGGAANVLGLAHLAAEEPLDAIAAFRLSAAANPRSLRPAEYAMAKANLALAFEAAADQPRALLAAGQASAVASASTPVLTQAREVRARLGARPGTLFVVLDHEPLETWPGVVREELARWIDLEQSAREAELTTLIDALASSPREDDLAEAWLGAVLELTPQAAEDVVRSLLSAWAEEEPARRSLLQQRLASAMARFHVPQWERLKDLFNRIAVELGQDGSWT
ncbi:MAG: soluble NSF attachment family protein, partial [Candidatus Dormibacteraeota bacterium]|nr:soluble NSF attachment family protein [Candidatus Dormibacteraeota bacterium]